MWPSLRSPSLRVVAAARFQLRERAALVTGASRGLGRAVARALVRRGCKRLAICARTRLDLEETRLELEGLGAELVYVEACDLSDETAAARFVANAWDALGAIDVVVANAGTITVGPAVIAKREDFATALDSLFYSALHPTLAILPRMRARGAGTFAFIHSIGGRIGIPHLAPYCAAKFAGVGLAEALRPELATDGIHVLAVIPGLMRTGSHVHARFKGNVDKEYAWFGAAATAPLVSIDADRAARRIVAAIERGDDELTFTPEARLGALVHTLTPGLFASTMRLVGRLLPRPTTAGPTREREGVTIEATSTSPAVAIVRERGRGLGRRYGQTPRRSHA